MKYPLLVVLCFLSVAVLAQDVPGRFLPAPNKGCKAFVSGRDITDSLSWTGPCKNKLAEGEGKLLGFVKGQQYFEYRGKMKRGKLDGQGRVEFATGFVQEGNFFEGEYLGLKESCLRHLHKDIVLEKDSMQVYVGDHDNRQLYVHSLIPENKIRGVLVLLPGTWETTSHLLSSTRALCEMAFDSSIAVLALSVNQRLTLNTPVLQTINTLLEDACKRYSLPVSRVVMGGWSMGGLFSLRYAELAIEGKAHTAVKPIAVFSVDGPCDLENVYRMFQRKLKENPNAGEPSYGIHELETYCGGSPDQVREQYDYFSCYSHHLPDGGNARFLNALPVRIYDDVDPVWWMENRGLDMYEMNALDQTAMVIRLQKMGNKQATFVNAFGKGYRLEGFRHPHSWSIVDPAEFMQWVMPLFD